VPLMLPNTIDKYEVAVMVDTICIPWQGDTSADFSHRYIICVSSINSPVDLKLNVQVRRFKIYVSTIHLYEFITLLLHKPRSIY